MSEEMNIPGKPYLLELTVEQGVDIHITYEGAKPVIHHSLNCHCDGCMPLRSLERAKKEI